MCEKLGQILADLENQRRRLTRYETEAGQSFVVFWGEVEIVDAGEVYPCDTTMHIRIVDRTQPDYSEYAIFGTFICKGWNGNSGDLFNRTVDKLNYDFLGKFVRDYTDGSQDIMYVTNECVNNLTTEVVAAHLYHHAKVKATVTLRLERLRNS